jgi:APA family basic amino acid/polyamine antiporter
MTTALVVGNMIGSGVFLLPAALAHFGGISILGWLFTSTGTMLLALVFSRLSRMVPKTGGPYVYVRHGFGDFAGFIVAWGYWIAVLSGNAAIVTAFVGYLTPFWPALEANRPLAGGVAIATVWLLAGVNARGIRGAGMLQLVTTVLKLTPLAVVSILGFFFFKLSHLTPFNLSGDSNFSAVTATASLTLWAFIGFESATIPAEDVRDPERTIPRATTLGTAFTAVVFIVSTTAVLCLVAPANLVTSSAPFADAATSILGPWAGYAVAAGAAIACFGTLNGWILIVGQIPFATARDSLFPSRFSRLSRRGTPVFALAVSSGLVTLLIAMSSTRSLVEQFTFIVLLSTLSALVAYILATMSELMILAKERRRLTGRKLLKVSVLTVSAFLYSLWAIAGAGQETVYWGFLLLLSGIPLYVWMKWRREPRLGTKE